MNGDNILFVIFLSKPFPNSNKTQCCEKWMPSVVAEGTVLLLLDTCGTEANEKFPFLPCRHSGGESKALRIGPFASVCVCAGFKLWPLIFPVCVSESVYFYHGWKMFDAVRSFNPLKPKSLTSIWEMLWNLTAFPSMQRQKEDGSEHRRNLFIFCPCLKRCSRV